MSATGLLLPDSDKATVILQRMTRTEIQIMVDIFVQRNVDSQLH